MGYNPQNAKEQAMLPPDLVLEGAIINLKDGVVKEIVGNVENWKGDINSPAIEVSIEVKHNNNSFTFNRLFTYTDDNGITKYSPRSNLGKYKKKYGKLPEVGDKVKAVTNSEGFLRLKLD
jgi:hypothetical protein